MAQRFFKLNLLKSVFPLLSSDQPRTTIVPSDGELGGEYRPSVAYCHNVIPTKYGLNSVGYLPVINPVPGITTFTDVKVIYGDARSRIYIGFTLGGTVYALLGNSTTWIFISNSLPTPFDINKVTIGTVNGISYLYYSNTGAYVYNEDANTLDSVTLTAIDVAATLGVVASSGYLLAYTAEAIAWSSTIDPTDFTPSQITGAGGGKVAGIAGAILYCTANTLGILVYAKANVIAGTYTGNTQFPFKFREVESSKGGISLDQTAFEANAEGQYVHTKAGLQVVSSRQAEPLLPEVTDFLAGGVFEDYNEVTREYETTALTTTMLKKVKLIASRYLIISYGITSFTHALFIDLALAKIGKFKIDHVDIFEYVGDQIEISKESIAILLNTGEVKLVDFSANAASNGVLILGKLQYSSTRMMNLLGVELENTSEEAALNVSSQASVNGKTFEVVDGTLDTTVTGLREYLFRSTAKNHSLTFIGDFHLVTALVRYSTAGRR